MGSKVIPLCLVHIFLISTAFADPEKPTATFSADVTEGYAPLHVHFTSKQLETQRVIFGYSSHK